MRITPTSTRLFITKTEAENIKNGDIVYTGERNGLECHIYINDGDDDTDQDGYGPLPRYNYVPEDMFTIAGFGEYWHNIFNFLKGELDIPEFKDYSTINGLINIIYSDFKTNILQPYVKHHPMLEDLDYRPLFLNIIKWSNNQDKMKQEEIESFPNIYEALNLHMNKNYNVGIGTDEDFLVNLEYTDIKEPDN